MSGPEITMDSFKNIFPASTFDQTGLGSTITDEICPVPQPLHTWVSSDQSCLQLRICLQKESLFQRAVSGPLLQQPCQSHSCQRWDSTMFSFTRVWQIKVLKLLGIICWTHFLWKVLTFKGLWREWIKYDLKIIYSLMSSQPLFLFLLFFFFFLFFFLLFLRFLFLFFFFFLEDFLDFLEGFFPQVPLAACFFIHPR